MVDDRLDAVFGELEQRCAVDPRLDVYRVRAGGPAALARVPEGFFLSDAMARIAVDGGWWPGWFSLLDYAVGDDQIVDVIAADRTGPDAQLGGGVRWLNVGSVWERDHFFSPVLRRPAPSAPLLGFSSQSLWLSMVFPHEAALLEAFIATYDRLGWSEGFSQPSVNPFFVEWVIEPPVAPSESDPATTLRLHHELLARSRQWTTSHPCWLEGSMPFLTVDTVSIEVAAALLDLDPEDFTTSE